MLVIADTSPLIALVQVGHVEVLSALFRQVIVPPSVMQELRDSRRSPAVRQFVAARSPWLIEQVPTTVTPIAGLHPGETEAISLALELKADLLLIDEIQGRRAALDRRLPIAGTVGVLERAADQGLLDLSDAFARLKLADFWISHDLLDERLRKYLQRKG